MFGAVVLGNALSGICSDTTRHVSSCEGDRISFLAYAILEELELTPAITLC